MGKTSDSKDPRVVRTKQVLMEALVDLTQHTGINSITVSQLTDKAKINRVTFYRHFSGMQDFLNQLLNEVFESLQHPPETRTFRNYGAAVDYYTEFFESVQTHENFFSSMLGQNGLPNFRQRFIAKRQTWHEDMVRSFHSEFNQSVDASLLAVSFIAVLFSLIEYWLHHGSMCSPRYMAEQLVRLTHDRVLVAYENAQQ